MFDDQTESLLMPGRAKPIHRLFRDVMEGKVASIADTEEIEDMYEHTIEVSSSFEYSKATST